MKFLLSQLFLAVSDVKSYQQKYVGKVKKKKSFGKTAYGYNQWSVIKVWYVHV